MNLTTGKFAIGAALTLAVVMVSSSTTVLAMTVLPKHSVGPQQLKTGAVTTKKLDRHSVNGSKVKAGTFVASSQMKFGKGLATSVPAKTILKLPRVHAVVTTDGTAGAEPRVILHVPRTPGVINWVVHTDGGSTYGTYGGKFSLDPPSGSYDVSATITHYNSGKRMFYVHCSFDTGFVSSAPLACWAISN